MVLQQLTEVEKRWTEANIRGDKDTLEEILAEDYASSNAPKTKREYMDLLKPDSSVKSWELQDLRVRLDGEHATLDGYLRQETTRGPEVFGFTDTFVWRDGRWQAPIDEISNRHGGKGDVTGIVTGFLRGNCPSILP